MDRIYTPDIRMLPSRQHEADANVLLSMLPNEWNRVYAGPQRGADSPYEVVRLTFHRGAYSATMDVPCSFARHIRPRDIEAIARHVNSALTKYGQDERHERGETCPEGECGKCDANRWLTSQGMPQAEIDRLRLESYIE